MRVRFGLIVQDRNGDIIADAYTSGFPLHEGAEPATITIVRPAAGDMWTTGTSEAIQWEYTGDPGPVLAIELLDGTEVVETIRTDYPVGADGRGSHDWSIPRSLDEGEYAIRVTSTSATAYTHSTEPFFVVPRDAASISVTPEARTASPAGGSMDFAVTTASEETMAWAAAALGDAQDWMRVTEGGVDADNGRIVVTLDPNDLPAERTGTVEVHAPDALVTSTLLTITQRGIGAEPIDDGVIYAVVAGVSDDAQSMNAAADAQAIWDRLSELDAWQPLGSTLITLDANTMRPGSLWDELTKAIERAERFSSTQMDSSNDLFLFYYSGHGAFPELDADEGETSRDYEIADKVRERATDDYWPAATDYISDDALSGLFVAPGTLATEADPTFAWAPVNKLFILDCAYAYGWWGEDDGVHDLDLRRLGSRTALIAGTDETSRALVSRALLTNGRGVLSLAVAQALTRDGEGLLLGDADGDGDMTFTELYNSIETAKDAYLPTPDELIAYKAGYVPGGEDVPYANDWKTRFVSESEFEMHVATERVNVPYQHLHAPIWINASDGTYLDKVRIAWLGVRDATEYQVYRSTSSLPYSATPISDWIAENQFDDMLAYEPRTVSLGCVGVPAPQYYWYSVKARNSEDQSALSYLELGYRGQPIDFTVQDPAPIRPASVLPTGGALGDVLAIALAAAALAVAGAWHKRRAPVRN